MRSNDYEAMFLLDNTAATEDFDGTSGQVDAILEKHGATLVQKEKWDERKLAYEIKGHRRATYYLVYFRAPSETIEKVNEDVRLTELILRHLVIRLDEPIEAHIENRAKEREALAEDSRKNSLSGWSDRKPRGKRRDDAPRSDAPRADAAPFSEGAAPEAAAPQSEPAAADAPAPTTTTTESAEG